MEPAARASGPSRRADSQKGLAGATRAVTLARSPRAAVNVADPIARAGGLMKALRTALVLAAALFAGCNGDPDQTEVRAMTYNLAVGIDLDTIFLQPTLLDVMKQAEVAWGQKDQSDFALRAVAIAAEIDAARPDLVGLQEVAQYWSQSPPDGPKPPFGPGTPAATLAKDFLVLLLAQLQARGLDYAVVNDGTTEGIVENADVEVTGATTAGVPTADYRIVDREVVLARAGVEVLAVRKGNFAAAIAVPVPGLPEPYPYKRGWVAVDARKGGKAFTFVSTHLDAFDPRVQSAQATELLALAPSSAPTLVVGDMNSDPQDVAWPAYGMLVSATTGYSDSAAEVGAGGDTCCYDAVCSDPGATLTRHIDLVLRSPHFEARSAAIHGTAMVSTSLGNRWPSDHAGVSVVLGLE